MGKNTQQSPSHEEKLLLEVPFGDGDVPHRPSLDTPDTSAHHGGPACAYTLSYEDYTLLREQLNEERANAIEHNKRLQMKLAPILAKKTKEELERILQGPTHMKSYERSLQLLTELKEKMKEDRATAEQKTDALRVLAEEKQSKVSHIKLKKTHQKMQVCLSRQIIIQHG